MRSRLFLLAVLLSLVHAPASATPPSYPALYTVGTAAQTMARGAQEAWPIRIDENAAIAAIFAGGSWLPEPNGGRLFARYDHHIVHRNGDLTFVGKIPTALGEQSAVITFGSHGVFGVIPQFQGPALRITTKAGRIFLLQASGPLLRSAFAQSREATPDFAVPPTHPRVPVGNLPHGSIQADTAPVVDVMIAYTPGFVSEYGSQSAALTRIDYVVDVANQAYADSGVGGRINLVHTVEVDYPDDTYDPDAVSDLTGISITTGQPVPIPASLSQIHALRTQYGADLVSMLRKYDDATNGYCGFAWIIGADQSPIMPSSDNAYGYSVVGDGSDNGYYCYDQGLAHELGHNMGSVHDHAHPSYDSSGNPITGAYPYSYGYAGGSSPGFFTIMAYGSGTQTPAGVFSSPNIFLCQSQPCGVADQEDNVRSLNQTMPLVAQFEASMPARYVHNDVNADGKSDLFWYSQNLSALTYWLMNGTTMSSYTALTLPSGYRPVAYGDFNGDGRADIVFMTPTNSVYIWLSNGNGGFTSQFVATVVAGTFVAGTGDVNHDGFTDIFWRSPSKHQGIYWLMNGATMLSWRGFTVPDDYQIVGIGDFNGNGYADMLWQDSARHVYMWLDDGNGGFTSTLINTFQPGWSVVGAGDVDGDGKSDIFWYNQGIGQMTYWLMDGSTLKSWKGFSLKTVNVPAGIGDFNGDGRADILWNQPNRSLWMWLGNSSGGYNSYHIVNYSTNYNPVNY